jgi:hypothetical protein
MYLVSVYPDSNPTPSAWYAPVIPRPPPQVAPVIPVRCYFLFSVSILTLRHLDHWTPKCRRPALENLPSKKNADFHPLFVPRLFKKIPSQKPALKAQTRLPV